MEALNGLISKELLELSYNDRNAINEEIHGVRCLAVKETPELMRASLGAFQSQIDSMPASKKEIYNEIVRLKQQEMAEMAQNPMAPWRVPPTLDKASSCSFAEDEKFRLRFLRCELFNVQKAVLRFLRYLTTSYEFFGTVALSRLVRISDLSKSESRYLRQGCSQVLPYRDRAGRCVLVNAGRRNHEIPLLDQAKIRFYIGDAVTRNSVESQQKGIVVVGDITAKTNRGVDFSSDSYRLLDEVIQAMPSRIVAIHSCWPDTSVSRLLKNAQQIRIFFAGLECSARIRIEIGKEVELRYKLRGYGIPIHLLPMTETGAIKVKYWNDWIRIRKRLEEASEGKYDDDSALTRVVICPSLTDVVFRQGTPSMKNPGNVIFRDAMINQLEDHYRQHRYIEGHQQQPGQIEAFSNWLINTTETTRGGRFLEWDKKLNVWVKITDRQKIKSKVNVAYRDATKRFLNQWQRGVPADNPEVHNANAEGPYTFVEGGEEGNTFCRTPNRDTRKDSNYNETSGWF